MMHINYIFDSDSFIIGIDNHASRSISNNIDHFSTALRPPKNAFIQGVGGEFLTVKGEGTLFWHIEDDQGKVHKISIKIRFTCRRHQSAYFRRII
jgi:hypothetical protein